MELLTTHKTAKPGRLASNEHVDKLIGTYKKERWVHNSGKLGMPDSLSTWYGLNELSAFLELARKHQADGIKMYYGVYPSDYTENPEFAGRQTIVLVATKTKETGNGTFNKNIYVNRNGKAEILAFNYGTLCPPLCTTEPPKEGEGGWYNIEMEKAGIAIIESNGEIKIV